MRRPELDYLLAAMLDSQPEVSDLLFTADKPLQVESFGEGWLQDEADKFVLGQLRLRIRVGTTGGHDAGGRDRSAARIIHTLGSH